jgi:hypothetical protein
MLLNWYSIASNGVLLYNTVLQCCVIYAAVSNTITVSAEVQF